MLNFVQEKHFTKCVQDYVLVTFSSDGYRGGGGWGRGYGDIYLLGAFKRDGRGGVSACCLSPGTQNQWGMHAGSRSSLSPLSLMENNVFLICRVVLPNAPSLWTPNTKLTLLRVRQNCLFRKGACTPLLQNIHKPS